MPINFENETTEAITIDGEEVVAVTIDGQLAYSLLPDELLVTDDNRIWNFLTGEIVYNFGSVTGHAVNDPTVTDPYIAYVNQDPSPSEAVLFNYVSKTVENSFEALNEEITYDAGVSPDGTTMSIGRFEGIDIFDTSTSDKVTTVGFSSGNVFDISVSNTWTMFIFTGFDGIAGIWLRRNTNTSSSGDLLKPYNNESFDRDNVRAIDISPKYNAVCGGQLDTSGFLLQQRTASSVNLRQTFNTAVLDVAVGDDYTVIGVDNADFFKGEVRVYDSSSGSFETLLVEPSDNINTSTVEITQNYIIVGDIADDKIYVYDKSFSLVNSFGVLSQPRDISAVERQ